MAQTFDDLWEGSPSTAKAPSSFDDLWEDKAPVQEAAPLSAGEAMAGGMQQILNGVTFGGGDRITGAGQGTADYLGNKFANLFGRGDDEKSLSDFVNERTAQVSDLDQRYQKEHPIASIFGNVAGAIQNPLSLEDLLPAGISKAATASLPGRVAMNTGSGALQGGLFGLGNSGGDIEEAKRGAALGSIFGAGAGLTGELLQNFGEDLSILGDKSKLGALGVRQSDIAKANLRLPRTAFGARQESPLIEAVNDISKQGGFKAGYDPQDVLSILRDQSASRGKQVSSIIKGVDEAASTPAISALEDALPTGAYSEIVPAQAGGSMINDALKAIRTNKMAYGEPAAIAEEAASVPLPDFSKSLNYISGIKGSAQKTAQRVFDKEVQGLQDTLDNGGTLHDWQKAKQSLQGQLETSYAKANPSLANEVKKRIASDIRQFIEDQTEGLTGTTGDTLKQLNKEIGQRKMLDSILERARTADTASTPIKSIIAGMRTSGGFGVPALITYGNTHDPLKSIGVGLGGALLSTRGGQFRSGQALNALGSLFSKASPSIFSSMLTSQLGKPDNDASNDSPSSDFFLKGNHMPEPQDTLDAIKAHPYYGPLAQAESGFDPKAHAPDSTAKGLFQFIDSTARSVGLHDPFDVPQSFKAVKDLTEKNIDYLKDVPGFDPEDPKLLYAAHVMGAPLLKKVLQKKQLDKDEQRNLAYFVNKALPNFQRSFAKLNTNSGMG